MDMNFEQYILLANGGLLTIVGYFLKQTMDRVKSNEDQSLKNEKNIELVRQENSLKHEYVTKEFSELRDSIKELNSTIKEFTTRLPDNE